ncbi:DUF3597 domain-containing protein [Silvimonas iriomotensis]|uniref:DUF3597 domain-containing protein n=1 Tax=Silvimonas iriomotensis TaxID=449662 RepID=A0ABQ2P8T2_9NEIS|nr:DUF3597 domain-containing protein [Silvimonas iriomotensis]GGP20624.1 hypothetical protein GCM10010970_16140 [Silvimonas iriomotensis]
MGIFSDLVGKLFGKAQPQEQSPAPVETAPAADVAPAVVPAVAPAMVVDVAAVLDRLVAESGQTLNWRVSIVDMMKALGLDSSLAHRKQLAQELGFTGDTADSASMNIWLHKAVLRALTVNGGKLPPELS